jgi:hypothetical protein
MSPFATFLDRAFTHGEAVLTGPLPSPAGDRDALAILAGAYESFALSIAGPPVPFDPPAAVAAAGLLANACWFLLDRSAPPETVAREVALPNKPHSAAQHLSADLTLRLLPAVLRRARAVAADDPLAVALTGVLRAWPLSGVLADLDAGPDEPPDFDGHPGLRLLYAERLAGRDRPAWRPAPAVANYLELVTAEARR